MVIINHSLGGDLTHLQVIDSGDVLVRAFLRKMHRKSWPAAGFSGQASASFQGEPADQTGRFRRRPHRGAPLAVNFIGRFGAG